MKIRTVFTVVLFIVVFVFLLCLFLVSKLCGLEVSPFFAKTMAQELEESEEEFEEEAEEETEEIAGEKVDVASDSREVLRSIRFGNYVTYEKLAEALYYLNAYVKKESVSSKVDPVKWAVDNRIMDMKPVQYRHDRPSWSNVYRSCYYVVGGEKLYYLTVQADAYRPGYMTGEEMKELIEQLLNNY